MLQSVSVLVLVLGSLCARSHAQSAPTVDLGYSKYQAVFDSANNVTSFLGMRFAAPPTGTLRWQAPYPPAPTPDVQQANAYPPFCQQAPSGSNLVNPFSALSGSGVGGHGGHNKRQTIPDSEDCLFLSVTVPGSSDVLPPAKSLPVVVWIHGGGYISQGEEYYDGTDLVLDALPGQVIAVTLQYRLGLFGFLPGSEVKEHGALNAGLLDQTFGLEWVQKNIAKFGGDPSRVTIWGESAGAGSVLQHIIANGGQTKPPLFRAAMTSSTFLPSQFWYYDTVPEAVYAEVVESANCTQASSTFECLQNTDLDVLETINTNINNDGFYGTYVFVPVIDGDFIVDSPTNLLKEGHVNGDVLLSVTNTFEGTLFTSNAGNSSASTNTVQYTQQLFPFLSDSKAKHIAELYKDTGSEAYNQSSKIMGESIFICPTYLLLQAFASAKRPQWKGEFAIQPGYHGNDVNYYFDNPGTAPPYPNTEFRQAFAQGFLNTVASLDPNDKLNASSITPHWPTWASSQIGTEMLFNSTDGTSGNPVVHTVQTDPALLERCAFWHSVANVVGQ